MTALDDLKAYSYALQEKRAIERQIERMSIPAAPLGGSGGIHPGGSGTRGTNDKVALALQQLEGLEALLARKLQELGDKAIRGERALDMIEYAKARVIMRQYYVLMDSDEKIARELDMGRATVRRIRQATEHDLGEIVTDVEKKPDE